MAVEIVTREDLELFRVRLLKDIRELFPKVEGEREKQWLKNGEVRMLLKISPSTLQRLRISGKLKSSKIGGTHYYRFTDVEALLESGLRLAS